ncbi:hypothetical protein BDY24DRAFT_126348 [Mrakia frigida]|uniref:uncharacterized protein n=1 Tax=Mrakia frigida TaxID=29902 RepID=UPI003FCC0D7E
MLPPAAPPLLPVTNSSDGLNRLLRPSSTEGLRVSSLTSFYDRIGGETNLPRSGRGSRDSEWLLNWKLPSSSSQGRYSNIGKGVPNTPVHEGWQFPSVPSTPALATDDAPSPPPISSDAPTPPPKARPFSSSPSVPSATLVVPDLLSSRVNSGISGTLKTAVSTHKVVFGNTGKARDESRVDTTSLMVTLEDARSVLVQKDRPSILEAERARAQNLTLTKGDSKVETQPEDSTHNSQLVQPKKTAAAAAAVPPPSSAVNAVAGPLSSKLSSNVRSAEPTLSDDKIDELDDDRNNLVPGTYPSKAVGESQEENNDRLEAAV